MNALTTTVADFRRKRDMRLKAAAALIALLGVIGYGVSLLPGRGVDASSRVAPASKTSTQGFSALVESSPEKRRALADYEAREPLGDATTSEEKKARDTLKSAAKLIKQQQPDAAIGALNDARELVKPYAESYLLMGRALEAKRDFDTARDFYNAALNRNPYLADAHWGFATSSEALGDLESALAGMRSYLHTEPDPAPERLRVNQARAAIWEWETQLGRGIWGPTKGIPPGFTAGELKRDGRGVAIKMPLEHTKDDKGLMKYEIKSADKIKVYPRP